MKELKFFIHYLSPLVSLNSQDLKLLEEVSILESLPSKTILSREGIIQHYLYFLTNGIVKGYRLEKEKVIVEHLCSTGSFFTSIDSFMTSTPSKDNFETVTACDIIKISKTNLETLQKSDSKWDRFIQKSFNENMDCKMERIRDFQTLTAKERYVKFVNQSPELLLNVSIDTIASYLGMEPQSLSRIRKQVII